MSNAFIKLTAMDGGKVDLRVDSIDYMIQDKSGCRIGMKCGHQICVSDILEEIEKTIIGICGGTNENNN